MQIEPTEERYMGVTDPTAVSDIPLDAANLSVLFSRVETAARAVEDAAAMRDLTALTMAQDELGCAIDFVRIAALEDAGEL